METGIRGASDMLATLSRATGVIPLIIFLTFTAARGGSSLKTYTMPGDACGYVVTNGDQFKVVSKQSPVEGHPDQSSYQADVSCSIIFRTRPGKRNFLRLSKFEVETSRRCTKDGLYLYDGGREEKSKIMSANQHALCGTTLSLPNYFTSTSHEVTLKFVTDGGNNSYKGFTVLVTPFEDTDTCDGFTCLLTKRCITKDAVCNSEYQCEDGSDEPDNCHLFGNTGTRARLSLANLTLILVAMVSLRGVLTDDRITL
ncbi:low-density lipoprotein receptor-related protein 12-like [Asterias rubens]|uniref:low-density lipoprotein receptor-related protein 12-like n=1 Tax=Asterias rubens TaxID=7604 RepID=UPI0014559018|nr:low-density lipoprotein receptor-related protein 12-like [Asterias rubens]